MDRVLCRLGLGAMVVTAWTGVASAPFGSPTLGSLLKIAFATMSETKTVSEEELTLWRAEFTAATCDPNDLLVFTTSTSRSGACAAFPTYPSAVSLSSSLGTFGRSRRQAPLLSPRP